MIEKLSNKYKNEYVFMAKEFYSSPAVMHAIPEDYILETYEYLLTDNPYAECYVAIKDEKCVGYMLLAKTYSQEAGGIVYWIEEIFVLSSFRNKGIGKEFFEFLENNVPCARFRIEVEEDNINAISLYKKYGFEFIPYKQMIIEKRK